MMKLDDVVKKSDQVVTRMIEGDMVIIPLTADIGEHDEELYTLNKIGQVIWEKLDGNMSLMAIAHELAQEYSEPIQSIQKDVLGFIDELANRKIVLPLNPQA
jgi:hypothetical protein